MIRFAFGATGQDAAEFARSAEQLGADALTWGESPTQFRDPYLEMALAAQATSRILLGTVMTCPGLRHPATLANQYLAVQRISGGRAYCGIGTGDLALIEMGLRPYTIDSFVEYASAVRGLLAGEEVVYEGNTIRMKLSDQDIPRIPVWFGADGPRGIRAAGEHADGIIVGQVGGPDVVRTVVGRAADAATAAGRSPDDLEIWFMLRAVVTEEVDGAADVDGLDEYATRGLRYLWRTSGRPARDEVARAVYERKGARLDEATADALWQFNDRWVAADAFGTKTNVRLMHELGLRDFAGRYFYVSGPPGHIVEQVGELVAAGGRNFITPFLSNRKEGAAEELAGILNDLR